MVSCRGLWWVWSETCEALPSPSTLRPVSWCSLTGCILTAEQANAHSAEDNHCLSLRHVFNPGLQISRLHAHFAAGHRTVVPWPSLHHTCPQTNGRACSQQVNGLVGFREDRTLPTCDVCVCVFVLSGLRGYSLMCPRPTGSCCSGKPARWSQPTVPVQTRSHITPHPHPLASPANLRSWSLQEIASWRWERFRRSRCMAWSSRASACASLCWRPC